MKTLQRDNGVTAHGASIRTIIYENGTFKQKPQNIYNIAEPISPEAWEIVFASFKKIRNRLKIVKSINEGSESKMVHGTMLFKRKR